MIFTLKKNKDNVEIETVKYAGDKISDDMKNIPQFLPKKNASFYIVGRPRSGKSTLLYSLLCSDGRKIKNKEKHKAKFYYKIFERVYIFSPSIKTSEKPFPLPPENIFEDYDPEILNALIENLAQDENMNCCFVFDDVIKSLNANGGQNAKLLMKLLLNRRHILYNPNDTDEDHISGCSSIITSQRYNLLPMFIRSSGISHLILFKITNMKDLNDVWIENAPEMDFKQFKRICDYVWDEPHNFLYIILDADITEKFHKNFDRIELTEDYLNT